MVKLFQIQMNILDILISAMDKISENYMCFTKEINRSHCNANKLDITARVRTKRAYNLAIFP